MEEILDSWLLESKSRLMPGFLKIFVQFLYLWYETQAKNQFLAQLLVYLPKPGSISKPALEMRFPGIHLLECIEKTHHTIFVSSSLPSICDLGLV